MRGSLNIDGIDGKILADAIGVVLQVHRFAGIRLLIIEDVHTPELVGLILDQLTQLPVHKRASFFS